MTFGLAVFAIAFALWRHRSRADKRLRLHEMMHLRGVPPLRTLDPALERDAAAAMRRCLACGSKALCDEQLHAGRGEGFKLFCPNALYVEWLRDTSLHFD